ncbi:hypothetical protein SKAU_G00090180 [Synaphobranchus kaupii]|uniref:Uncharacterized protein n=1 Tax=Synaphobranchus kaupii TaxID=118154 RepID=A0A9Q1FWJ3_SYNKA|nr:hypothetical protein SKAU_G00090180 [Synaphobranchus kaupii]
MVFRFPSIACQASFKRTTDLIGDPGGHRPRQAVFKGSRVTCELRRVWACLAADLQPWRLRVLMHMLSVTHTTGAVELTSAASEEGTLNNQQLL